MVDQNVKNSLHFQIIHWRRQNVKSVLHLLSICTIPIAAIRVLMFMFATLRLLGLTSTVMINLTSVEADVKPDGVHNTAHEIAHASKSVP